MATYTSKKAYMYGTGRRKSSVARVHLFPNGTGSITVNGRPLDDYFGLETLKLIVRQPFAATDTMGKFDVEATVTGGGVTGQAGAIRHGIARALLQKKPILLMDETFSAIDKKRSVRIIENIRRAYPEKTILLISHEEEIVRCCDEQVMVSSM